MATQDYGVGTRAGGVDAIAVDDGNFNYNEKIPVEASQRDGQDLWIRPEGGVVNQAGPFTFTIPPLEDRYIQLNRARLYARCKVTKLDGSPLESWKDICAPVNLLGAAMWERVDVQLNGQPFAGGTTINAGYKALLETMLSYDQDGANTHLHTQFYHPDSPGAYFNMRVSEDRVKAAFRDAIVKGQIRGPDIPPYLEPDRNSADYKLLSGMGYNDADAIYLPDGVHDPNDDGLHTVEEIQRAREEERAFALRKAIRDRYINEKVQALEVEEEAMEEEQPEETPEEKVAREERNVERVRRNREARRRLQEARDAAFAEWNAENPLTEREKRRIRRVAYRRFAQQQMAELDEFLSLNRQGIINRGFDDRYHIVMGSASFDMHSPITHDFFKMNNHLAPGNRVDLRLTMYPHNFLLNSMIDRPDFKLVIEDLKLHYHTILLRDRVAPPLKVIISTKRPTEAVAETAAYRWHPKVRDNWDFRRPFAPFTDPTIF